MENSSGLPAVFYSKKATIIFGCSLVLIIFLGFLVVLTRNKSNVSTPNSPNQDQLSSFEKTNLQNSDNVAGVSTVQKPPTASPKPSTGKPAGPSSVASPSPSSSPSPSPSPIETPTPTPTATPTPTPEPSPTPFSSPSPSPSN